MFILFLLFFFFCFVFVNNKQTSRNKRILLLCHPFFAACEVSLHLSLVDRIYSKPCEETTYSNGPKTVSDSWVDTETEKEQRKYIIHIPIHNSIIYFITKNVLHTNNTKESSRSRDEDPFKDNI